MACSSEYSPLKLPSKVDWRIDAKGKRVIPGLVDAHVHFFQSGGLCTLPDAIDLRTRMPYAQEVARIKQRLPYKPHLRETRR